MRKGTIGDFSKKLNFWQRLIAIPMCAEYNGASFMITSGVMTIFMHTGRYIRFSENVHF